VIYVVYSFVIYVIYSFVIYAVYSYTSARARARDLRWFNIGIEICMDFV